MVAPVTGPFYLYPSEPFADNYRKRFRQKMPIDRPLEYRMYRYYGKQVNVYYSGGTSGTLSRSETKVANFSPNSFSDYSRKRNAAYNAAYERLKSQVSDRAGWAENLAQIGKTREAIVNRLVQFERFTLALARWRWREAERILRSPMPSRVSRHKGLAQNFLEWEYGWKPLISDLESSAKVLTSDPGDIWVRGRATEFLSSLTRTSSSNSSMVTWSTVRQQCKVVVTCRAGVRITNPNIALANQLGFIDLALPWKLLPFSFVLDWFVNFEQVISSVTDWYGMQLLHPHYTVYSIGQAHEVSGFQNWQTYEYRSTGADKECCEMDRILGLPSPTLIVKPFKGFSLQRGLQAIALILATLGK